MDSALRITIKNVLKNYHPSKQSDAWKRMRYAYLGSQKYTSLQARLIKYMSTCIYSKTKGSLKNWKASLFRKLKFLERHNTFKFRLSYCVLIT